MSTRIKLLHALHGTSGTLLSGESLAKRLGVSRASVWKHIRALQVEGLPIEGEARAGYRFTGVADFSLTQLKLDPSVSHRVHVHYDLQRGSTQTDAKAAALNGAPEGSVWIAEIQRAGRGRLQRSWESPFGGLWFSLVLRPNLAPSLVPPLTQVAALALRKAIAQELALDVRLKWPNDLLVQVGKRWKKVAGILTELSAELDRTEWVVIGMGVNANNPLSRTLTDQATSLAEVTGKAVHRGALLNRFLRIFFADYRTYAVKGFAAFREAYWRAYFDPGGEVRLRTAVGAASGIARGVDGSGGLIVESRRKIQHFFEGEIVL